MAISNTNVKYILYIILLQIFVFQHHIQAMELDDTDDNLIELLILDWEKKLKINYGELKSNECFFTKEIKSKLNEILDKFFMENSRHNKSEVLKKFVLRDGVLTCEDLQALDLEVENGLYIPAYYLDFKKFNGFRGRIKKFFGGGDCISKIYFFKVKQEVNIENKYLDLPHFVWSYYYRISFSSGINKLIHITDKKLCFLNDVVDFMGEVQKYVSLECSKELEGYIEKSEHEITAPAPENHSIFFLFAASALFVICVHVFLFFS